MKIPMMKMLTMPIFRVSMMQMTIEWGNKEEGQEGDE